MKEIKTPMGIIVDLIYELNQNSEISESAFEKLREAAEYNGLKLEQDALNEAYAQGFNESPKPQQCY